MKFVYSFDNRKLYFSLKNVSENSRKSQRNNIQKIQICNVNRNLLIFREDANNNDFSSRDKTHNKEKKEKNKSFSK